MLYQVHALQMEMLQPFHQLAKTTRHLVGHPINPFSDSYLSRHMNAGLELVERLTANYDKPDFGLNYTTIDDEQVTIREEDVYSLPYCDLLHFRRVGDYNHPKLLIVAPLSGHYSTLLRNTVEHFLPDHEVFITDWRNARDVRLQDGVFHLDDYISYVQEFIRFLGPNTHLLAVCQASVPTVIATSLMAMDDDDCQPTSMTLLAGPVDARVSPTDVNDYATNRDVEWFERHVICKVPMGFGGEGQRVYPGFIQLSSFMSMNWDTHVTRHHNFYSDLVKGDGDSTEAHRKFYNEYLAVMDIPADFYLETVRRVFLEFKLPRGKAKYRGHQVETAALQKTALLTIEGGQDDICGEGQTHAAHDICTGIPTDMRERFTEHRVGHYGTFNGRHFREEIGPRIKRFIARHDKPAH